MTVNSVLGKAQRSADVWLVEWIRRLCDKVRPAAVLVAGTHPPFHVPKVQRAFQEITDRVAGAVKLYDGSLPVCSGSPRRYEPPAWVVFKPKPQLGHVVGVRC